MRKDKILFLRFKIKNFVESIFQSIVFHSQDTFFIIVYLY